MILALIILHLYSQARFLLVYSMLRGCFRRPTLLRPRHLGISSCIITPSRGLGLQAVLAEKQLIAVLQLAKAVNSPPSVLVHVCT
jgi:hypothetical protein